VTARSIPSGRPKGATAASQTGDEAARYGLLDGRVAVVIGGGGGLGRDLALGVADHGARVGVIGPSGAEASVADAVQRGDGAAVGVTSHVGSRAEADQALAEVARALGPIDVVVHALVDPAALVASPLTETDERAWDARCEGTLRTALACAQASFLQLRDRGGRLVFVTPTVALTGAAGLVPYVTALEGIRALVKSAARQWGRHGITANCVAPPVALVAVEAEDPGIEEPALGRLPDARRDVAPVVAMLGGDPGHFVTGSTVTVDGGVVMAP
jgi:2-hydroxycyclohexanecarboxyl-CoA dehydrogenase